MRLARTLDRQRVRFLPCAILGRLRAIGGGGRNGNHWWGPAAAPKFGWVPERPKGADCKSAVNAALVRIQPHPPLFGAAWHVTRLPAGDGGRFRVKAPNGFGAGDSPPWAGCPMRQAGYPGVCFLPSNSPALRRRAF